MKKEIRTVRYDKRLKIEAYHFQGITKPFPNHFHEYYVIGFIETGQRILSCKGIEYVIKPGDILLFNPGDNHACAQNDEGVLNYRGINISKEVMFELTKEIAEEQEMPVFSNSVIHDDEAAEYFYILHKMLMNGAENLNKEEVLFLLISFLVQNHTHPLKKHILEYKYEIEKACEFIEKYYAEHICLKDICDYAGLSSSTLLRAFTKTKGVTPYCYLENIRISKAKKMLEQYIPPIDVAAETGFSDQSHFTNCFSRFIGLTPRVYQNIFINKKGD